MPCIFCVAVLFLIAGALTAEHVDEAEEKLRSKAEKGDVKRLVDSGSVAKFELTVRVGSRSVPVAVTIFKDHKRVRIQVLTHDLTPEEVDELQEELAEALDARIVDRAGATDGSGEEAHEHTEDPESERVREQAATEESEAERQRVAQDEERPPSRS